MDEIILKGHIFVFFCDNTIETGDIVYKCKICNYKYFKNKRKTDATWEDLFVEPDSNTIWYSLPMTCDEVIIKSIIK